MKVLTTETFEDFIRDNHTVIVDFWAPWCGSCKAFTEMLEGMETAQVTEYNTPKVQFAKVNAGIEIDLANRYGIVSLPTVIIFCDGKPTVKGNGTITHQIIEAAIRSSK